MSEIKTQLEAVSPIKKKISIEVPSDRVNASLKTAFEKVQKEAQVKGFRKGHVPTDMVEKMFGEEIRKEAIEELVGSAYVEGLQKEQAIPVSYPKVELGTFEKDKAFDFSATFEVKPEVKVSNYEALELTKEETVIDDSEIDARLKYLQQSMTQLEPAADGDVLGPGHIAVVDFVGTADGEKFKGSEAKDFVIDFGNGTLMPALEAKLLGMKKSEVRDVDFDYPADYFNKELAGKKGAFNFTLKDLRKKIEPELNDEFAKDLGNFNTIEDVRKDIRAKAATEKEQATKYQLFDQVMQKLIEANQFEVPEAFVMHELKLMLENLGSRLQSQGKTLEQAGIKVEEFAAKYRDDAAKRARGYLILDAIGNEAGVKLEDAEIDKHLEEMASRYGKNLPEIRRYFQENDLLDGLKTQLLHEKVLDFVISKSKIKIEKPKKEKKA